jgi:hypothetical protein
MSLSNYKTVLPVGSYPLTVIPPHHRQEESRSTKDKKSSHPATNGEATVRSSTRK